MTEIGKAWTGMIAVAAVILESVARRLMGARGRSSGVVLMLAGVVLLVAAGGASAEFACIADDGTAFFCGDTVTKSCTLNGTMVCPGSGLIIGADDITIDGYNPSQDKYFGITGSNAAWSYGIYNYEPSQYSGYDNVAIKNLDISGFQEGICIRGTASGPHTTKVENNVIYNCEVHDNGANTDELNSGYGIHFYDNVWYSTIDNCKVYNTIATISTSCDSSGAGIRMYGKSCHNSVTNCEIYGNALAGIYSKMICEYNHISNNNVFDNAAPGAGSSFPGGIRLQCIRTNHWTVEFNNVWGNYGPGIFVGGQNNAIGKNDVTGSKNCTTIGDGSRGDGIIIDRSDNVEGGRYNTLTNNRVCDNAGYDIYVQASKVGNTGDENTCDITSNYDDDGTTGCTFLCSPPEEPDLVIVEKSETLDDRTFKVTYTVKNNGGADAGASTTGISVGGTQVATDSVGELAAGASHTSNVTIDPFDCPCGTTVTVKVCADRDGAVDESDETNNCLENTFNCPACPVEPQLCTNLDLPAYDFGSVQQGQTRTWTFEITNCGGKTLTWTVSDDRPWITVSPTGGSTTTETDTVTVTIDTTGLTVGATHSGTITVGSNDGTKTGAISVSVQQGPVPPQLHTNPDPSYNFGSVQQGQTQTWTFDVTNCGGETLTWTVSDDQPWITVSPTGGSTTTGIDAVTVTIDTTGLADGAHSGAINVSSNGGTKTGTIGVHVETSLPTPPPPLEPADVPTFTPIGILSLSGLLGIVAISSIRRGKSE